MCVTCWCQARGQWQLGAKTVSWQRGIHMQAHMHVVRAGLPEVNQLEIWVPEVNWTSWSCQNVCLKQKNLSRGAVHPPPRVTSSVVTLWAAFKGKGGFSPAFCPPQTNWQNSFKTVSSRVLCVIYTKIGSKFQKNIGSTCKWKSLSGYNNVVISHWFASQSHILPW